MWRKEVIGPALDAETVQHMAEQRDWIASEPGNATPYFNLAQLCRIQRKQDEALGLLLEAVSLRPEFGEAHVELAEIYAIRHDYPAAWRHARAAERAGKQEAVELLGRFGVEEG